MGGGRKRILARGNTMCTILGQEGEACAFEEQKDGLCGQRVETREKIDSETGERVGVSGRGLARQPESMDFSLRDMRSC